jgi:hypothetical protein
MLQISSIDNMLPLSTYNTSFYEAKQSEAIKMNEDKLKETTLNNKAQETSNDKAHSSNDDNEQETSNEGSTTYDSPILLTLESKKSIVMEKILHEEKVFSSFENQIRKLKRKTSIY